MANRNEKEASRKRILSTCVRLFLEQGFKHTPPKQILTEADVSAGTFYNLYRTKAGVLTELTEFMFQNQFTIAGQIVQGETDPVKLYAVETAIQLTLAELNENLRQIYVEAYFTLERKLECFLQLTLRIYCVPEEKQREVMALIASLDIRAIANEVMQKLFAALEMHYEFTLGEEAKQI